MCCLSETLEQLCLPVNLSTNAENVQVKDIPRRYKRHALRENIQQQLSVISSCLENDGRLEPRTHQQI